MKKSIPAFVLCFLSIFSFAQNSVDTLSVGRFGMCSAVIGDKALFAGDSYLGSDVVDIYNNTTGTWSVFHMNTPKNYPFAKVIGDRVYFFGLQSVTNDPDSNRVIDVYDNISGTWSIDSIPAAVFIDALHFEAEVHNQDLVFLGKAISPSYTSYIFGLNTVTQTWWMDSIPYNLASSEFGIHRDEAVWLTEGTDPVQYMVRYDLNTQALTLDTFPQNVVLPLVYSAEDKTFFVGGHTPFSAWTSNMFLIYDHLAGTFLQGPTYFGIPQVLRYGNKVLFTGGTAYTGSSSYYTGWMVMYDLSADTFVVRNMSDSRGEFSLAADCGKFYIAGGWDFSPATESDHIDILDTLNATVGLTYLSSARGWVSAAAVNQTLLVAGGSVNFYTPKDTVDVIKCIALAVPEPDPQTEFSLFPNPATDEINLFCHAAVCPSAYEIYNTNGERLIANPLNHSQEKISISQLPPGMYFLLVRNPESVLFSQRFLISK